MKTSPTPSLPCGVYHNVEYSSWRRSIYQRCAIDQLLGRVARFFHSVISIMVSDSAWFEMNCRLDLEVIFPWACFRGCTFPIETLGHCYNYAGMEKIQKARSYELCNILYRILLCFHKRFEITILNYLYIMYNNNSFMTCRKKNRIFQ